MDCEGQLKQQVSKQEPEKTTVPPLLNIAKSKGHGEDPGTALTQNHTNRHRG